MPSEVGPCPVLVLPIPIEQEKTFSLKKPRYQHYYRWKGTPHRVLFLSQLVTWQSRISLVVLVLEFLAEEIGWLTQTY